MQDLASPNYQQHPVQDASSKQQTKQKCKPNHQQTGLPSHSALPIRGKTNKQNLNTKLTLSEPHKNPWANPKKEKPKGRKKFKLLQGEN